MGKVNVNEIDKENGSTLTLGGPGTAVTLACGATQTGFGRTGTVDWCTTAKTSPFTAVNGDGFFVNTTSGAITVTLPASPSAGDIVAFKDYAGTWATACKDVTLNNNGSKINGTCATATLNTANQVVTLIYVDGTKGWQSIQDDSANVSGQSYITATGGTITNDGDFKVHTFTASGCFQVTNVGSASGGGDKVSYVVVAGGGGGGGENSTTTTSAGGGAGGYREGKDSPIDSYTASPLAAADSGLPVSVQTYPITIGAGGAGGPGPVGPNNGDGTQGSTSTFSTISSAGGGFGSGKSGTSAASAAGPGGSGGGAKQCIATGTPIPSGAGAGNDPPVSPPQGNNGGASDAPGPTYLAGGGGGAGAVGGNPSSPGATTGNGGAGVTSSITGSSVARSGGGGAGKSGTASPQPRTQGSGGTGGGGAGAPGPGLDPTQAGAANTGGGGGGGAGKPNPSVSCGGTGGSGVVIIRYKFQ